MKLKDDTKELDDLLANIINGKMNTVITEIRKSGR